MKVLPITESLRFAARVWMPDPAAADPARGRLCEQHSVVVPVRVAFMGTLRRGGLAAWCTRPPTTAHVNSTSSLPKAPHCGGKGLGSCGGQCIIDQNCNVAMPPLPRMSYFCQVQMLQHRFGLHRTHEVPRCSTPALPCGSEASLSHVFFLGLGETHGGWSEKKFPLVLLSLGPGAS